LNTKYLYKIYSSTTQLPLNWDSLATKNIFLSKKYLEVLEQSRPKNMECHFIGVFYEEALIGIALSQFIDLNQVDSFQSKKGCLKTVFKKYLFTHFSSHILFIGNNMLTGQNAFCFNDSADMKLVLHTLKLASNELKKVLKTK
jgi:hypothetical protein